MSSSFSSGPRVVSSGSGIVILRCSSAQIQARWEVLSREGRVNTELGMEAGILSPGSTLPTKASLSPGSREHQWAVGRACVPPRENRPLS